MATVDDTRVVRGACHHDCPDTCAWQVTVEDGRAVKLVGDREHPFTHGGLCAKVNSYIDARTYNPERVLHPLRRTGPKGSGGFERVGWDEALSDIAARVRDVVARDGSEAILPYSYLGNQGMVHGMSIGPRFFARLGASRLEATVCGDNGGAGLTATLGTSAGLDPEEIVHARLIILWGTNTVVTNLHLWPFIQRARKAGAKVVVVDPVRTRTAQAADQHVRPRPGTDVALALGLMHVIVSEGLCDTDYVERHTLGFEALQERLVDYPVERVAGITGVPAEEIVALAREYATVRPAAIRTLVGMEHRRHGAMAFRTIACLPALTGAWRDRGGGLIGMTGRFMRTALATHRLSPPEDQSVRSLNMMQIGRHLTSPDLDPPVRALFVFGANPAATSPNQSLVLEGLRREDLFTVVHEHFMTDTARHADYVLPATTQLEHLDLVYSWGHLYVSLNLPAIEPQGEAISTAELFRRLARELGFDEPELQESDEEIIRSVLDSDHPWSEGITYEALLERGWMKMSVAEPRPFADGGFPTPSGRCELYSQTLLEAGLDPLPGYEPPSGRNGHPLSLITAKDALHFLNSSYSGVPRHRAAEGQQRLHMSAADAAARGLADGDVVVVYNDRGEVELPLAVGDVVGEGVVAMPSGWWASQGRNGRSANALTSDGISPLGRGGDFHDTFVEVRPAV